MFRYTICELCGIRYTNISSQIIRNYFMLILFFSSYIFTSSFCVCDTVISSLSSNERMISNECGRFYKIFFYHNFCATNMSIRQNRQAGKRERERKKNREEKKTQTKNALLNLLIIITISLHPNEMKRERKKKKSNAENKNTDSVWRSGHRHTVYVFYGWIKKS